MAFRGSSRLSPAKTRERAGRGRRSQLFNRLLGVRQRATILFLAPARCLWQGIYAPPCEPPGVADQPGHASLLAASLGSDVFEYVAGKIQAHLLAPCSHRSPSVHVFTHCVRARKPTAILPSRARDEAHVCPVDTVHERPHKGPPVRAAIERGVVICREHLSHLSLFSMT